jgi:integrase
MNIPKATGYVRTIQRADGPVLYAKLKLPDGTQPQRRLGRLWTKRSAPPDGFLTRGQAEARLASMLAGEDPTLAIAPIRLTFGAAVDEWLDRTENVDKRAVSTLRDYRGTARLILTPHFGKDTPLEQITREQVQAFADELARTAHYSQRTRQKSLILLARIFKVAQIHHGFPTNPVTLVHKGVVRPGEVVYFTHADVALICDHADPDDADLFKVMSRLGHRRGEIVAMCWLDVDFPGGQVHIRKNYVEGEVRDPKDYEVRSVPMQDDAAEVLARMSLRARFTDPEDLVFGTVVGAHQNPDNLSKRFTDAKRAAGLVEHRGTLENLRHTFATYAGDTPGVMPQDVQRWLGHSDIKTTMRYMGVLDKLDAAALLSARTAAEPQRLQAVHRRAPSVHPTPRMHPEPR